ncbi:MAG: HD domain-containing protein [Phototrophicaceae bacterium]|jgi:putative hydrolase of HD superfamily
MASSRLEQHIRFLMEMDKLKHVERQTVLKHIQRRENTAEHSWHVALAASLLAEYSDAPVDVGRVVKMLLVHDIVEIDAGDTYAYNVQANQDRAEREQSAADRIFGLLPDPDADDIQDLWEEFEDAKTPDAKYANAIDQLLPLLYNVDGGGLSWKEHHPTYEQVVERCERRIRPASARLWELAQALLAIAVEEGWLTPLAPDAITPQRNVPLVLYTTASSGNPFLGVLSSGAGMLLLAVATSEDRFLLGSTWKTPTDWKSNQPVDAVLQHGMILRVGSVFHLHSQADRELERGVVSEIRMMSRADMPKEQLWARRYTPQRDLIAVSADPHQRFWVVRYTRA